MKKLALCVFVGALGLTACSGGSGDSAKAAGATTQPPSAAVASSTSTAMALTTTTSSVPPTTTPAAAPTTSTTVDPMQTAQIAYAGLTGELNPAIDEANKKHGGPTRQTVQAWCADMAPVYERFAGAIRDGDWPASVKDEADTLAKAAAADTGLVYQCANAKTTDGALAAYNAVLGSDGNAAASAMRLALGMPISR